MRKLIPLQHISYRLNISWLPKKEALRKHMQYPHCWYVLQLSTKEGTACMLCYQHVVYMAVQQIGAASLLLLLQISPLLSSV